MVVDVAVRLLFTYLKWWDFGYNIPDRVGKPCQGWEAHQMIGYKIVTKYL